MSSYVYFPFDLQATRREKVSTPSPILSRKELLKLKQKMASHSVAAATPTTLEDQAKEAVKAFFEQRFDPETELDNHCHRMKKDGKGIDWTRFKEDKRDILYISSKFDVREWWSKIGQEQHVLVFWVAPPMLALPSHNGFWNASSVPALTLTTQPVNA